VGGDSGSSMSTSEWRLDYHSVDRVCVSGCGRRLPWYSISLLVQLSSVTISRTPRIYLPAWGRRQSDPLKPARYVFSCFVFNMLTPSLARPSPNDAKYPIHLACLQSSQNLRKLMESSVPSSELPSKCPVVILILKSTNLATKTLASLNISEQGPRFCRL
jgi:hypothetical protein